jgi:hypothetical protein
MVCQCTIIVASRMAGPARGRCCATAAENTESAQLEVDFRDSERRAVLSATWAALMWAPALAATDSECPPLRRLIGRRVHRRPGPSRIQKFKFVFKASCKRVLRIL